MEAVESSRARHDRVPVGLYSEFASGFLNSRDFLTAKPWPVDRRGEVLASGPCSGDSVDEGILPLAESALILSTLAIIDRLEELGLGVKADGMAAKACSRLFTLVSTHRTGSVPCLDGRPWGLSGRSPRAAAMAALAGWLLLSRLDAEAQDRLWTVLAFEADRINLRMARWGDWDALNGAQVSDALFCLSVAVVCLSEHPRRDLWDLRLRQMASHRLFGAPDSQEDPPPGWTHQVSVQPDLSILTSDGVSPAVWALCSETLGQCAVPFLMKGLKVPEGLKRGVLKSWESFEKLLMWDGTALHVQGNVGAEKELFMTAVAANSLLLGHSSSSYLHQVYEAVSHKANIPVKDPLYFLLHLFGGDAAPVVARPGFTQQLEGAFHFPTAGFCIHRTPTKMASFSWKDVYMGLAVPEFGGWLLYPSDRSLVGEVEAEGCDNQTILLASHTCHVCPNGFTVTADLRRCDHSLSHRVAFASLPNDTVVYLDSLLSLSNVHLIRERVGLLSVLNCDRYGDMLSNRRTLYTAEGERSVVGISDKPEESWRMSGSWVNVDDQMGCIVSPGGRMMYRDRNAYRMGSNGDRMDVGEDLILIASDYDKRFSPRQEIRRGSVIMGLNQSHRQTRMEAEIDKSVVCPQDAGAVFTSGYLVVSNFSDFDRCLQLYVPKGPKGEYWIFEGEQRISEDETALTVHVPALSTRFFQAFFQLLADSALRVDITARGLEACTMELKNNTEALIEISATSISSAMEGTFELMAGSRHVLRVGT